MRHCFRFFPAAVLLSLLVTACAPASSPDAPSLQATELGHGTSHTSVETQIQSGSLSSDNGAWLTLQVKNLGGTAILVTLDKDPETCITIEPGASGTLTTELSAVPSDHLFQLRAAQAGAELYAAHTLIQSTKKPAIRDLFLDEPSRPCNNIFISPAGSRPVLSRAAARVLHDLFKMI